MTGSNKVEIIIPHKNTIPTPEIKQVTKPTPQENNKQTKLPANKDTEETKQEIYLPDSTRTILNQVMKELAMYIPQEQMGDVAIILSQIFHNIDCIRVKKKGDAKKRKQFLLQEYINAMKVEGKSNRTLAYYRTTIQLLIDYYPDKHIEDITTDDLREYIYNRLTYSIDEDPIIKKIREDNTITKNGYKKDRSSKKWSKRTADNNRRILNTFYKWLVSERIILFNPLDPIKKIKYSKTIKKPFSTDEIMKLRDGCNTYREKAMIEFLLSTGCRVGEAVGVKINDIDWHSQEVVVHGKGDKERYVYLNDTCIHYLKEYLDNRSDGMEALWITYTTQMGKIKPLGITGFETCLRELGNRVGVNDVHPHRFRHTFATTALNRGISLEHVQIMLGHANIDTTLLYAKVANADVKHAHKKYMNL